MMVRFTPADSNELKLAIGGMNQHGIHREHGHINDWDVSLVTNMEGMLLHRPFFNEPLNRWNVSNVTNMKGMFSGCRHFNQPLDHWNVSNVVNMDRMFFMCDAFNQNLNSWNVSNVTRMNNMFESCTAFNQPLNRWNVSKVTSMNSMFENCMAFNQPLNRWNVSNVTSMSSMFSNSTEFNQPLNNWNVGNLTGMHSMFDSPAFQQVLPWRLGVPPPDSMFEGSHGSLLKIHSPSTIRRRNGPIAESIIKRANHPNMMNTENHNFSPIKPDHPRYTKRLMRNVRTKSPQLLLHGTSRRKTRSRSRSGSR
jgi:surface protein